MRLARQPPFVLPPPTLPTLSSSKSPLISPSRRQRLPPLSPVPTLSPVLTSCLIAALSSTAAQLFNAPLTALTSSTRKVALFADLPLHILKRVPTKTLTVFLTAPSATSPTLHAALSALSALATYPLSVAYYAIRSPSVAFLPSARARPAALLSGALPALGAVLVAAAVDKAVYTRLSSSRPASKAARIASIAAGAALSATLAGACAEPLKAVARKAAVSGVAGGMNSLGVAREIWGAEGVVGFWRGFPARALRYSICAPVAKVLSRGMKGEIGADERLRFVGVAARKRRVVVVGGIL